MKHCDIKGCHTMVSGIFSSEQARSRWIELRACRCGAGRGEMMSCICIVDENPEIPTQYWPNLDWFAMGGVEKVTLCPRHKVEVGREIAGQRNLDSSMNPIRPNPTNRH